MDDLDAGVADQDVDAAVRAMSRVYTRIDGALVADVHSHAHGDPTGGDDFGGGGLRSLLLQIGNDHLGAFPGERMSDLLADPARCPGDHNDLVLKAAHEDPILSYFSGCKTVVTDLARRAPKPIDPDDPTRIDTATAAKLIGNEWPSDRL